MIERGFATRFTLLEWFGFARLKRLRLAGLEWFRFTLLERLGLTAFRTERRALIGLWPCVFVVGAIAPADGRALHLFGRENFDLGLFEGRLDAGLW